MDKLVFIKNIEAVVSQNGNPYTKITDQDNATWSLFSNIKVEVNRAYLFTFEVNAKGFNNIQKITPLVNIFQQKALKEVSNRNDFLRLYGMAVSYSKDLVMSGKVELPELFTWADKIYDAINLKADNEMGKLEPPEFNLSNDE